MTEIEDTQMQLNVDETRFSLTAGSQLTTVN